MRILLTALMTILLSTTASATKPAMCTYPKELSSGFDQSAYQHCEQAIKSCPVATIFRDVKCVDEKLTQPSCHQLSALAKLLDIDAQMISAKQVSTYTVFKILFPGDGGEQYYLLSRKGCLIDTNINPADIDPTFKKKFAGKEIYHEASQAPQFSILANGDKRFTQKYDGHDQCRACKIIVKTKLGFDFTKDDSWSRVTVIQYK